MPVRTSPSPDAGTAQTGFIIEVRVRETKLKDEGRADI